MKMRDARTESALLEIRDLLEGPLKLSVLGARPHLLHVAVLFRLMQLGTADVAMADIKDAFERATNARELEPFDTDEKRQSAVSSLVGTNLLEHTAYMTGLAYPNQVALDSNPLFFSEGDWVVVGSGLPMTSLPKALARKYYENCVEGLNPVLRFEFDSFAWSYGPRRKGAKPLSLQQTQILAAICIDGGTGAFLERFCDSKSDNSITSDLRRLRKGLRDGLEISSDLSGTDLIIGKPKREGLRLAEGVSFVGLVRKSGDFQSL